MRALTDLEFDILNALYFVEPFENILDEVEGDENVISSSLKDLIDRKLVVALEYKEDKADWERTFMYDSDNMHAYRYLITKEGLIAHNTRPARNEDRQ